MIIPGMVFRHKINATLIVIDVDPEQIHVLTKDCRGIRHNMLAKDLLEFYNQLDEYDFSLIPSGTAFIFPKGTTIANRSITYCVFVGYSNYRDRECIYLMNSNNLAFDWFPEDWYLVSDLSNMKYAGEAHES